MTACRPVQPAPVRVKICGITSLGDALAAVEAGADMLGFNFYPPSPRYIRPAACAALRAALQARGYAPACVGVFVNASPAEVAAILEECGLDRAQLSGDEPPEALAALGPRAFKGIRPPSLSAARASIARYAIRPTDCPPALLVDAAQADFQRAGGPVAGAVGGPAKYGGTGRLADWELARVLAGEYDLLLAGGLNPRNVAAAIQRVRPWGVDVASGVESEPGKKDRAQMAAFVAAARRAAVVPIEGVG